MKGYMRDRSRASDLERGHAIDDQINEQFGKLEKYLEKKIR